MLTSNMIKDAALAAGADKCGIAPILRLSGAPDEMNPKFLFPCLRKKADVWKTDLINRYGQKKHGSLTDRRE